MPEMYVGPNFQQIRHFALQCNHAVKSYYGGPIGTYQCSFERYHSRPPTASSSLRLGVRNSHPKNHYYLRNR